MGVTGCPLCDCHNQDVLEEHHITRKGLIKGITIILCANCHTIVTKKGGSSKESLDIYKKYLKEAIKLLEDHPKRRQLTFFGGWPFTDEVKELRKELQRLSGWQRIDEPFSFWRK